MTIDDPAAAHLATIHARYRDVGAIDYLREAIQRTWLADLERHDPEGLFDDARTLGFNAAINLDNRIFAELRTPDGGLSPDAIAIRPLQTSIVCVGPFQLRCVKLPVADRRSKRAALTMQWAGHEGRVEAARENGRQQELPRRPPAGMEPLVPVETSVLPSRISDCRNVFLVWGGEDDGRTAGWIGLPVDGPDSWLALEDAWFDEEPPARVPRSSPTSVPPFGSAPIAMPEIRLKPQPKRGADGA